MSLTVQFVNFPVIFLQDSGPQLCLAFRKAHSYKNV